MNAEFGGRVAQSYVIVVVQAGYGVDFAADVGVVGFSVEGFDRGMFGVAAEYFFGFFVPKRGH